jgi:hypothetical protein
MLILGTRRTRRAALALASLPFLVCQACQPGLLTTPAVSPVPPLVLGLPLYLMPEPTIFKLDDPSGRPLAITLEHEVRDALEAAGFKLAPTPEAANGVVARLVIQKVSALEQDVFIKGGEACGVRLEIPARRGRARERGAGGAVPRDELLLRHAPEGRRHHDGEQGWTRGGPRRRRRVAPHDDARASVFCERSARQTSARHPRTSRGRRFRCSQRANEPHPTAGNIPLSFPSP